MKIYKNFKDNYDYKYNWINENISDTIEISIKDVLKKFKPEELIDAIGVDKVELILRKRKIDKIKNNIKK